MDKITLARLKELLHYDAVTGEFTWRMSRGGKAAGSVAGNIDGGYVAIQIDNQTYYASHLAWFYEHGSWPLRCIDHEDQNPSNNAIENLREVTYQGNNQNRPLMKTNVSGYTNIQIYETPRKGTRFSVDMPPSLGRPWRSKVVDTLEEALTLRDKAYEDANYHPNHGKKRKS